MEQEQVVAPGAETQNPAPEPTQTPDVVNPETATEAEAQQAEPEGDEADKSLKRMERRIAKRTADLYRERAEKEQLARRLSELESQVNGKEQDQPQQRTEDVESLVQRQVAIRAFADRANGIVEAGSKANADFLDTVKELAREVGEFVQRDGAPSAFMEVMLEVADDPAKLMYHLGKNPDIAEDLAELPKYKLAKRLASIERDLGESSKQKTSSAPKPIEPVRAAASDSGLRSDLSTEEWMRRREKQIRERRGA